MKWSNTIMILLFAIQFSFCQSIEKSHFLFNHVALAVKDLSKSATFYSSVLGLKEITNRTAKEGIKWFSLGEDKELHLIATVKGKVKVTKAIHIGLTTSNFSDFVNELVSQKIKYRDWDGVEGKITVRADGIKQIYILDPNGYWVEINSVLSQ